MSLINDMLRDLESRHGKQGGGADAVFDGLASTPGGAPSRPRRSILVAVGAALLAAAATAAYLWYSEAGESGGTAALPVASSVPAGDVERARGPDRELQTAAVAPDRRAETDAAVGAEAGGTPPHAPDSAESPAALPPEPAQSVAPPPPPSQTAPPDQADPPPPVRPRRVQRDATSEPEPAKTPPAPRSESKPDAPAVEKTVRPLSPRQQAAKRYQQALADLRAGRRAAAIDGLEAALAADPAYGPARETLVALHLRAGELGPASALARAGLEAGEASAQLRKLAAQVAVQRGDTDAAIAVLEAGGPAALQDPEYAALLGALYQETGRYAESAGAYRQAVAARADQGLWWLGMAIALEQTGEHDAALRAYRRAAQAGVADPEVRGYIAQRTEALGG